MAVGQLGLQYLMGPGFGLLARGRAEAALSNMCMGALVKHNWSTVALFHHTAAVSVIINTNDAAPNHLWGRL